MTDPHRKLRWTWIGFACFPWLGGIGLLIAGATAKRQRWTLHGAALLLVWIPYIVANAIYGEARFDETVLDDIAVGLAIAAWGWSIYFALHIRDEWTQRRNGVTAGRPGAAQTITFTAPPPAPLTPRTAAAAPFSTPASPAAPAAPAPEFAAPQPPAARAPDFAAPQPPAAPVAANTAVDVNAASPADLATLDTVIDGLGARIERARRTGGPFVSDADFESRLALKPHEIARIAGRIRIPAASTPSASGRRVDF